MKRKELKAPDAFQKVGADTVPWLILHQKTVAFGVVAVVLLGGVVTFAQYLGHRGEGKASEELGGALRPMSREVSQKPQTDADKELGKEAPFANEKEKEEAVIKTLTEFRGKHKDSRAAGQAALPLGQALLRQGKAAEAAPLFDEYLKISTLDDPLRPTALEGKGYALEAKKDFEQASLAFDQLARETKGDFMKGMGTYHKGRLMLLQGKNDEGVRLFQSVIAETPNSSASRLATERITALVAMGVKVPEAPKRVPDAGRALAVCLALAGCKTISFANDGSVKGNDARVSPERIFDVEWWNTLVAPTLLEFQPRETAAPAVDPDTGRIIVCTRDGFVRCLSPEKGLIEWEKKIGGRCFAGGRVHDGVLYLPAGDGSLYALRSRTGEQIWRYPAGEELVTTPIIADGRVLIASQNDTLFVIDAVTGKWVWQQRRDTPSGFSLRGAATPRVEGDTVYMGYADGSLVALKLADGMVLWERNLSASGGSQFIDVDTTPVVDGSGHVYGASFKDGVYSLDTKSGEIAWTTAMQGVTSLTSRGDVLYTAGDGQVGAVQASTGRSLWKMDLSNRGKRTSAGKDPLLTREMLFVPTSGALVIVDTATGKVRYAWNPGKGITASPTQNGRRLYILSNLGTVFSLRLRAGGGVKRVRVVAALIADDRHPDRYLVQQRLPDKSRPNLWEFPGGKVEAGETDAGALERECREELGVGLEVGSRLWDTVHTYSDLTVELVLYRARVVDGVPRPLGAQALHFATPVEMKALPFCEADLPLLEVLGRGGF